MKYLEMVRSRHRMRNDPQIDPVPWELDDKHTAAKFVLSHGYLVPRSIRCESITEALEVAKATFGDRFVLKPSGLHSGVGVYMLERIAEGLYFDARQLTTLSESEIQPPPAPWRDSITYWLAEEWVLGNTAGRPIPFDYRVYAFNGQITHVAHSDYNLSPPHRSIFDGAWIPLEPGADYQCNFNLRQASSVFPRHAARILAMAQDLSAKIDTRFVRVDLFDGPDGPVFGEFSFFPGSDDTGEITYSARVLDLLDQATEGVHVGALSGYDIDMDAWRAAVGNERGVSFDADVEVYSRVAAAGLGGHLKHFDAMKRMLPAGETRGVLNLAIAVAAVNAGDDERAFEIAHLLRSRPELLRSSKRLDEIDRRAIQFADSQAESNAWWRARAAELRLARGEEGAVAVLRVLAQDGLDHAARVLVAHGYTAE